jgi:hypothetical protein
MTKLAESEVNPRMLEEDESEESEEEEDGASRGTRRSPRRRSY